MGENSVLSHRAAAVAVIIAFIVGLIGSLALRPVPQDQVQGSGFSRDANTHQVGADNQPKTIHWRIPISSGSNLPVIGDNPLYLAKTVGEISRGSIQFDIYEPGEIVPALAISDAVRDAKVQAGYTWLGYDQGKMPASALLAAVPFGMEPWEYSAWWYEAGGSELAEALYHPQNIHPVYCGMTGPETAGWFRFPIKSLDDVAGLKIRFAGIGGKVIERLGASVTMLPAGEIFQALEKGAIDASEFALPVVDEALGFDRVAKYNYYPGWHQPFTATHFIVNLEVWEHLAKHEQNIINTACTAAVTRNLARSEALQGRVIRGFESKGVTAERLPLPLLHELKRVAEEVLAEEAGRNKQFATILASQKAFLGEYQYWKRLAYLPRDFE